MAAYQQIHGGVGADISPHNDYIIILFLLQLSHFGKECQFPTKEVNKILYNITERLQHVRGCIVRFSKLPLDYAIRYAIGIACCVL